MRRLIKGGVDINEHKDKIMNPLQGAAMKGHATTIRILLVNGAEAAEADLLNIMKHIETNESP